MSISVFLFKGFCMLVFSLRFFFFPIFFLFCVFFLLVCPGFVIVTSFLNVVRFGYIFRPGRGNGAGHEMSKSQTAGMDCLSLS